MANNLGIVTIRELDWAKIDAGAVEGLNSIKKELFSKAAKENRWIEIMQFSPDGNYLAVGDHKQKLTIFSTKSYKLVKPDAGAKAGHSSALNGIDWSRDSKWLRTTCQAGELIFWEIRKDKKLYRDPKGASNTVKTDWVTQTCKFGWNVDGIIPSGNGPSDINSVAMSSD